MGKKNWIEFDNHSNNNEKKFKLDTNRTKEASKINISKQKKGKTGKTITVIKGVSMEDKSQIKELLKKMKVFCGTGGKLIGEDIQLQGDMIIKSIEFLRKEGFQNL